METERKWGEQGGFRAGKHEEQGESCFKAELGTILPSVGSKSAVGGGKAKRNEDLEPGSKLPRVGCAAKMLNLCKSLLCSSGSV